MGIIYTISVLAILAIFMLIKKLDKELNGLGIFGLGIVLILCYNVFECYILNFFNIDLTLLNLSIVNYIIIILGIIYLVKKKEIQKYIIKLRDIIFSLLIGIVIIIYGAIQYGYPVNIKYETTDAVTHYRAACDFAGIDSLINKNPDELWDFRDYKIGSYVNSGLIMKVFSDVINMSEFDYYKIFVIFDLFILFMTGFIMYLAFIKLSKGKLSLIAFIFSLLFVLGYPLNATIFGFQYMSMGILIVATILYATLYYTNKDFGTKWSCLILFLLNFQLFQSYYQFVPYMYSALFIYICIFNYREDKKIFTKKNILMLFVTLIIPFILGYGYYMAQNVIYNMFNVIFSKVGGLFDFFNNFSTNAEHSRIKQTHIIQSFSVDGYVYNNLYSNIILLLPMVLFVIIKERKKIDFSTIAVVFNIGYVILLFIGGLLDWISDYYVTKNYYALWVILFFVNFKGLVYLYENKKSLPYIVTSIYIAMLIITSINFNIYNVKNKLIKYDFTGFAEVYNVNKAYIDKTSYDFYPYELELLEYAKDNLDKNKKIEMLGTQQQIMWAYPLLDYYYYYPEMEEQWYHYKLGYKHMNNEIIENADYVICLYRSDFYKSYDKTLLEDKEIIFENEFGKIIKNE